jgi:tRNA 2-thiouridine synthesizing protein C
MKDMRKSFLFVLRRSPYGGIRIREALDMILTAGAFEQAVRLLVLDDGVYQLQTGQRPELAGAEPVAPLFGALELYDIEEVWVERESLLERGLTPQQLVIPVRLVDRSSVRGLTAAQDIVVAC